MKRHGTASAEFASINCECATLGWRLARRDHQRGLIAVFDNPVRRARDGDYRAVGQTCDAGRRIAVEALLQPWIGRRARISIAVEPFPQCQYIAAAAQGGEAPTRSAHGDQICICTDQHVRLRRPQRHHDGDHDQQKSAPPQPGAQQADQAQAGRGCQQRTDAERRNAPHRTGQARHPERNHVHPLDPLPHCVPERAVEAERHGRESEQTCRHHPHRDDRHREQVGDDAVWGEPMKVERRVRPGREASDERRQRRATPAPAL
jgi:hypothetical protein